MTTTMLPTSSRSLLVLGFACLLVVGPARVESAPTDDPELTEDLEGAWRPPSCNEMLQVVISPLIVEKKRRMAEVLYDFEKCSEVPHRAVIYEQAPGDPELEDIQDIPLVWSQVLPSMKGRLLSNYSVPRTLPGNWDKALDNRTKDVDGDLCFGFRAALVSAMGRVVKGVCLKAQPLWMTQLVHRRLGNLGLTNMMIPGTHNSGCFPRYDEELEPKIQKYLLTQDLSIWEQLVMGSRYFDIRVGYYPRNMGDQKNETHPDHNEKLWVNHDMVRVQPLRPLLQDIRLFLDETENEVVVLDFHRFPVGFGSADDSTEDPDKPHEILIALLKSIFHDVLVDNTRNMGAMSLSHLAGLGKRVVISYGERSYQVKESKYLWSPIPQQWGNQQQLDGLYSYLDKQLGVMVSGNVEWFALMAQLTPTMFDIVLNAQRSSLRVMADAVNANMTASARRHFWKVHVNIIAVDFLEGTDIVNAAVEANTVRSTGEWR